MKTLFTSILIFAAINLSAQTTPDSTKAVRCKGITAKKEQCKKTTKDKSGYCWMHNPVKVAARKQKATASN